MSIGVQAQALVGPLANAVIARNGYKVAYRSSKLRSHNRCPIAQRVASAAIFIWASQKNVKALVDVID